MADLAYEIAVLLADYITSEARRLRALPADKETRAALRAERRRIKDSIDPLDLLIAERMQRDAAQQQTPE